MKKKIILIFITLLILLMAGCGSSSNRTARTSNIKEQTENINEEEISANVRTPDKANITKAAVQKDNEDAQDESRKKPVSYIYRWPPAEEDFFLKSRPDSMSELKLWGSALDLRQADLRGLDFSNESERLTDIVFDTSTIWPEKLPDNFNPEKIMETGKNPGLGIRDLQSKGITGKGVSIAIIDQPLLIEHEEYCDRIKWYDEINAEGSAAMHGAFVASISVGKSIGVAPEADLYYIGSYNMDFSADGEISYTYIAEAVDKIIEINKSLPDNNKIRALSMSMVWCPDNKGYKEITEAVERAKKEGIFVISCDLFESYGFWTYSMDKLPAADPDDHNSYFPFKWKAWLDLTGNNPVFASYYQKAFTDNFNSEFLLVPIGSRTHAIPTAPDDYRFVRTGGWSLMEPYLAGLYALACQVYPDITPERFWEEALKTGEAGEISDGDNKYSAKLINPANLIKSLQREQ